jgi:hypothetical protein
MTMALTNAEKQAQWRARREERIKALEQRIAELEAENLRLRNAMSGAVRAPATLDWEVQHYDDGGTWLTATMGPYVLFANPDFHESSVFWWIGEDRGNDEELVDVAEGEAPTLFLAKSEAETAGLHLILRSYD